MKYELSEESLKDFLINIKEHFNKNKNTIHKARNELKNISYNEIDIIVKSFKIPSLFKALIYSYLKDSKAKKSYLNAKTLLSLDIPTPKPLAFIEFYKNGLLKESFYLSKKQSYDFDIRKVLLNKDFKDRELILKNFAKFTLNLHNKGIYHKDYSPGNILIKKENNIYEFIIVDINRLKLAKVSMNQIFANFAKLSAHKEDLLLIASEYARLKNINKALAISLILKYDEKETKKKLIKNTLRKIFGLS